MEVAGQWRREWAGTAEYGKVTEGGVTKRVARAMEVLHASAPGARVRVLRAAYHSTAGPGVPASSYMLQSSRRVISSGYDFVEPTSLPSKPLEISSIPLEMSDTEVEKQNYKVTEPDDLDISEPSKWRSGVRRSSIRMPSEESSSTDNASIIDLDSRTHRKNSFKNHIFEHSQDSIKPTNPKSNRVSPLLDAPVTLSTLKYKSLLNGSDDWNNRRKSYSFEDTAPLNKIISDRKDRFAIESSTDSGICKSSEIVNDVDTRKKDRKSDAHDETFKDWLYKNRLNLASHAMKPVKEHSVTPERLSENNIILQSSGKVCITLPVAIETENGYEYRKPQIIDENDRKSKKVEFCKTELHFAADTGTVNIIATDEKPPPTNDFRRRRSAFVPINDRFEKSVTLFGDKSDFHGTSKTEYFSSYSTNEVGDSDENTAATKSILKNKIPKPKPYLLGENMSLGNDDTISNAIKNGSDGDDNDISGVTLVNAQLRSDKIYCNETRPSYSTRLGSTVFLHRTTNEGTFRQGSFRKSSKPSTDINKQLQLSDKKDDNLSPSSVKRKLQMIQKSPTLGISNSRQLRESDLMYFGIEKDREITKPLEHYENKLYDKNNEQEEIFESVRLVRKISNSVCSSEVESDEAPEYQNLLYKTNYTPVPAPRVRNKYTDIDSDTKTRNLNSIEEQDNDDVPTTLRRSRLRRQETSSSSRSISEPPKTNRSRYKEQNHSQKSSSRNSASLRMKDKNLNRERDLSEETASKGSSSLYVNLKPKGRDSSSDKTEVKQQPQIKKESRPIAKNNTERVQSKSNKQEEIGRKKAVRSDSLNNKINFNDSSQTRKTRVQRTEKLVTPELPHSGGRRNKNEDSTYDRVNKTRDKDSIIVQKDQRIRSLHRHTKPGHDVTSLKKQDDIVKVDSTRDKNYKEIYDLKHNTHSLINNNITSNTSKKTNKLNNKIPENYHDTKKSRRSSYVINYDDKEGTMSSVRKIKPHKYISDNKNRSTKENKENSIEHSVKIRQINKIALQKIPDQKGKGYMEKARKVKNNVHKPCQLL